MNETIEDIVEEMRDVAKSDRYTVTANPKILSPTVFGKPICAYFAEVADRIETAWRRDEAHAVEHATHHAESVARGNCRDCIYNPKGDNYEHCNAAAIREALEMMCSLFEKGVICTSYANTPEEVEQIEELYRKAKAARSSPPRNCDRFNNEREMQFAFLAELLTMGINGASLEEYSKWLLAEAKGEGDGSK